MVSEKRLISVDDCPCDGCPAKPCGHPARCVKFTLWLNKTVDAVVLPCKIGDSVWGIRKHNRGKEVKQGTVYQMFFGEHMKLCLCVKNVCRGEWGKNIFATKEEAKKALAKMAGNENA